MSWQLLGNPSSICGHENPEPEQHRLRRKHERLLLRTSVESLAFFTKLLVPKNLQRSHQKFLKRGWLPDEKPKCQQKKEHGSYSRKSQT
jgi:hypothetical protein